MNQSFRNNKKERETGLEPNLYLKNILFIGGFRTALLYSPPYSTPYKIVHSMKTVKGAFGTTLALDRLDFRHKNISKME